MWGGGGGGSTKQDLGASQVLSLQRWGSERVLAMKEGGGGGGTHNLQVVLTLELVVFAIVIGGGGGRGARSFHPLKGHTRFYPVLRWGRKTFQTCNFPIL